MRRNYFLTALVLFLTAGFGNAAAETQSPYKFDFNTEFSTSANDFIVGKGWGHLPDAYVGTGWGSSTTYPTYRWDSTNGVDGTGCLKVESQDLVGSDYDEDYGVTQDLIITPAVTGEASIYVKRASRYSTSDVKFYVVTKENGNFVRGEEITASFSGEINYDSYVKATLPAQSNTYIGIRGTYVYLDDFEAESAEIELVKALTISKATFTGSIEPDCNAEGNFPVTATVEVTNSGDVDLNPGDENYSLSIVHNSTGEALATVQLDKPLAVGATETFELAAEVPYEGHENRARYDVRENLSGTSSYLAWIEPTPYAPVTVIRNEDGRMENGEAVDYGMVTETVTKSFSLENDGAAPLNVTEVVVPEGFTTSLTAPVTIDAHQRSEFTITMTTDAAGVHSGDFIVKGEGAEDFTLSLSGTVLDPNKFFADFEDGEMPAGVVYDADRWSIDSWEETGNSKVLVCSSTDPYMFVLPQLEVAEGEKMSFSAGKRTYNSYVNVYYSADRNNWTLLKEITADDMPTESVGSYGSYDSYALGSFVVEGVPAGKYYIAFESGYARIDNIYGFSKVQVDHDLMFTSVSIPTSGKVNNEYVAKVSLHNINTVAESDYSVELYVGDEPVAKAEADEIQAGETKELTLGYTPHETGAFKAYVLFKAGEYELSTDVVDMVIGEETSSKDVVVGTATALAYDAPLNTFYKNSESETVYTAEQLGLNAGDKITKLTYRGYGSDPLDVNITAWMENTDDNEYATTDTVSKEGMTRVYEAAYSFNAGGSETDVVDMLTLDLTEPFVYDGRNLRIVLRHSSDSYKRIYFQQNADDTQHSIIRYSDAGITEDTEPVAKPQAVVVLSIATEPAKVSGTVSDSHGYAVPGAEITLTSGDVIYKGTAGNDGKYEIGVIQTDKTYTANTTADGFADGELTGVAFADGDLEGQDITMKQTDTEYTTDVPALVCLPLDMDKDAADAAGKFYALDSYEDGKVVVKRSKEGTTAGVPYVFVPAVEMPFTGMSDYVISAEPASTTVDGLTFSGTYGTMTAADTDTEIFYGVGSSTESSYALISANGARLLPFSAYFTTTEALTELPEIEFDENDTSGVNAIEAEGSADDNVYTLDGRVAGKKAALKSLKKGVYITGGKKVVVK